MSEPEDDEDESDADETEDEEDDPNHGSAKESHKWAGWAEAFTIFAKYSKDENGFDHVAGEHDEIFAGPNPEIVSAEDKARLSALGWSADNDVECFQKFT